MKISSDMGVVNQRVEGLHNKKVTTCKMNTSFQASRSSIQSKRKPISLDNDIFAVLSSLEDFLQKDITHFKKIGTSFDNVEEKMKNTIKVVNLNG